MTVDDAINNTTKVMHDVALVGQMDALDAMYFWCTVSQTVLDHSMAYIQAYAAGMSLVLANVNAMRGAMGR